MVPGQRSLVLEGVVVVEERRKQSVTQASVGRGHQNGWQTVLCSAAAGIHAVTGSQRTGIEAQLDAGVGAIDRQRLVGESKVCRLQFQQQLRSKDMDVVHAKILGAFQTRSTCDSGRVAGSRMSFH